jgi:hypothetical protein
VVPIATDAVSNGQFNRAVVIAMSFMYMVQMTSDEVVGVIAVGDSFMSAAAAVLVTDFVTSAGVSVAALRPILGIHVELVFIHMVAMHKVHVPIVKETLMPIVHDGGMAALFSMLVCVFLMNLMFHTIGPPLWRGARESRSRVAGNGR